MFARLVARRTLHTLIAYYFSVDDCIVNCVNNVCTDPTGRKACFSLVSAAQANSKLMMRCNAHRTRCAVARRPVWMRTFCSSGRKPRNQQLSADRREWTTMSEQLSVDSQLKPKKKKKQLLHACSWYRLRSSDNTLCYSAFNVVDNVPWFANRCSIFFLIITKKNKGSPRVPRRRPRQSPRQSPLHCPLHCPLQCHLR